MLEWLRQYGGSLILGGALLALVLHIIYRLIQNHKEGRSSCCGGGCKQCGMSGACHSHGESHSHSTSHSSSSDSSPSKAAETCCQQLGGASCSPSGARSSNSAHGSPISRISSHAGGRVDPSVELDSRIQRVFEEYEAHKVKEALPQKK